MKHLFGKRLSALLLALVMMVGMVPAASAAKADITRTVDYDESVELKRDLFYDLFEKEELEELSYVEFTDVDTDFDDYGYFEAYDEDDDLVRLDASDIEGSYFYYFDRDVGVGDYCLNGLEFVAYDDVDSITLTLEFTMWDEDENSNYDGILEIKVIGVDGEEDDEDEVSVTYEVEEDDYVKLDRKEFEKLFEDEYKNKQFSHLTFGTITNFDECGSFKALDHNESNKVLDEDDLEEAYFYYNPADVWERGDYELGSLTFTADDDTDGEVVTLKFTLYDEDEDYELDGVLYIEIGDVDDSSSSSSSSTSTNKTEKGDLHYEVDPDDDITIPRKDFKEFFEEEYDDFSYLVFDKVTNMDGNGEMTVTDMYEDDVDLDEDELEDGYFYYYADDMTDEDTDYELNGMTFYADEDANGEWVTFEFTLYGEDEDDEVEGTMTILIGETTTITATDFTTLRYSITGGTAWQINVNDIARFYEKQYPGSTFQYVKLMNVPTQGGLYYDYYNTSSRTQLTASNISSLYLYRDAHGTQSALSKLTYIPSGSNYTSSVLFTAYGSGGNAMGALLIGVTKNAISEVYGVTPKNTAVTFPASALYNAVYNATGAQLASIQLLQLPSASVGAVTASSGYYSFGANTSTYYTYGGSSNTIGQLKFVPATNYTGSVEIPYVAYDGNGLPIAYGKFCLGVVNSVKRFSDVGSSVWCYKYVTELSDANVIGGYTDNTFKPNNTITYGAALKLITLAAGHGEKAPTGTHTFSGYLTYAQQKGWVTGNVNLSGTITRLQIAQLAAKAMGLSVSNLSSTRPFTDTADVYVQALNAAGIIEGYFSNGSYAYRPNNTLTRGQVSAIVWRMRNYN